MKALIYGPVLLLAAACNSLFYQPDHFVYNVPSLEKIPFEEVSIPSTDNIKLAGWLLKTKKKPKGLILHFHGNAQNMSAHYGFVKWLPKEGFHVLTFDYRGYGKVSGEPSRDGVHEDGIAALKWVDKSPLFKDLPLIVIAQSLGGAIAVPALAKFKPRNLRAVILESTFDSHRKVAQRKLASTIILWPFQWPLSLTVGTRWDPVDYISQIGVPTLFIHGTEDEVISYEAGRELYENAPQHLRSFWTLEGGGHTPAVMGKELAHRTKLSEFINAHIAKQPGLQENPPNSSAFP